MSVTTFTTVNGMILSQAKGGVVSHFVPDPLGSVVMVRDTSGNTVYEAEYDPYGNVQSETGTNPSSLGFVGTLGYIKDSASNMYVRARYLLNNLGRWLTKDPLWPSEPGYVYAGAAPAMGADPSGAKPISSVCPPPPMPSAKPSCTPAWNQFVYAYCNCNRGDSWSRQMCNYYAMGYYADCRSKGLRNKPKPKGDWIEFAPPPGQVGEVTPRPVPLPDWATPDEICAVPLPVIAPVPGVWPDPSCLRETSKLESEGSLGAFREWFGRCNNCCQNKGLGPGCYQSCRSALLRGSKDFPELLDDLAKPFPSGSDGRVNTGRPIPPRYMPPIRLR